MAFVEGRGWIAPTPIKIRLSGEEVRHVRSLAKHLHKEKPFMEESNIFTGWLGEAAFAKFIYNQLGVPHLANLRILEGGDGGIDAELYGVKMQIKTHTSGKRCAVKRAKKGQLEPLPAELFVFVEQLTKNEGPEQDLNLLGWVFRDDLLEGGKLVSGKGWHQTQIDERYLKPMIRIAKYLFAKKGVNNGAH